MFRKGRRSKPGKKHRIIFITHSMNRVWRNLLFADVVLWIVWWMAPYSPSPYFIPPNDKYLAYAGFIFLGFMILALLMRGRGYIQARDRYVLLRVPFFRLRIPYHDIENVRMASFREIYQDVDLNWASRRFLKPYFKNTVATLLLKRFPIASGLLRVFIPSYLFLPKGTGLLLLIQDYIGFNTEVDSRLNAYRDRHGLFEERKPAQDDEYGGYFNLFDD
jgi:hypothetical protein